MNRAAALAAATLLAGAFGYLVGRQSVPPLVHISESVEYDWRCACGPGVCQCCLCAKEPVPSP